MRNDADSTRSRSLIIVLGVITAFDAMAIDLYLPGFRDIGRDLNADPAAMQASLALFVGGAALGQLFYGPAADRLGRRGPLAFGIALFMLASVVAALASSTTVFLIARALQGLGAAAGLVIPRAIIADRYPGHEIARYFSALLQVMMIAPIIAPPLGGALLAITGWRGMFWALALISAASLLALFRIVPETLLPGERTSTGICASLRGYVSLFKHGRLIGLAVSSAFAMAGLFAYVGSSSLIFVDHFGLSPTSYSLVLAGIALGMVAGGQVNEFLLARRSERTVLTWGLLLHGGCGGALLTASLVYGAGVYVVGGLLLLAMACLMLVVGNGFALVMNAAPPGMTGSVSSLLGVLQYGFAGVAGLVLAFAYDTTLTPFNLALLFCAAGALVTYLIATKGEQPIAHG
jgi:DHA1 family bicyclomycin/chloramphenicol resistance-like MFS transporter